MYAFKTKKLTCYFLIIKYLGVRTAFMKLNNASDFGHINCTFPVTDSFFTSEKYYVLNIYKYVSVYFNSKLNWA
jgi:hypothetical protein